MTHSSPVRPLLIAIALLVLGCGGCGGGGGGTAKGGSGGAGGRGGATGSAGRGGSGGSGAGGTAGTAGTVGTGGSGGSAGVGGTVGSGGAAGRGGTTGTAGASGGGGTASPIVVTTPLFSVAAGESTQCVVLDLGNAAAIHVGEIKTTLSAAVYEVRIGATSGAAQTTPAPCSPFGDIDSATVKPLVFAARSATDDLVFPTGIGYTLAAHQLLRFEVHASSPAAGDASVSATFTPVPDATFQQEAGLLFFEETDISIAPQATSVSVGPVFFPLSTTIGGASLFRMVGYTHKLGTALTMATATSATDPSPTTIYSPVWDPSNPAVVNKTPPVALPSPGGIALACTWNNSGGQTTVRYGTAAQTDERCAGVVSYYPAAAAHRCIHSSVGGGIVLCCPGSGGCP